MSFYKQNTSCFFILLLFLLGNTVNDVQACELFEKGFEEIVKKSSPAVVHIEAYTSEKKVKSSSNKTTEIPFISNKEQFAYGSGFLISSSGYLLTNKHVIENKNLISVTLHDKRSVVAKIIAVDPIHDLALLKIKGNSYTFLYFDNTGNVNPGNWSIALSNPYQKGPIVTFGIISAVSQSKSDAAYYNNHIQTDALIIPGSSGGPLLNPEGLVIGIISATLPSKVATGSLGFALSAETVKKSTLFQKYSNVFK